MHRQSFFLVPLICLSSALWAAPATVNVEVLQDKLDHPWALAFLPDNHGMLITLRGGELRHWQAGKGLSAPLSGVPDVWAHGQGGEHRLHDRFLYQRENDAWKIDRLAP